MGEWEEEGDLSFLGRLMMVGMLKGSQTPSSGFKKGELR